MTTRMEKWKLHRERANNEKLYLLRQATIDIRFKENGKVTNKDAFHDAHDSVLLEIVRDCGFDEVAENYEKARKEF